MARYTGPKTKIARKFGEAIFGDDKSFEKRNYPPGQHGNARRRGKKSEYAIQLAEKQKAKYTYGILERQFRNMFKKSTGAPEITGEVLLKFGESLWTMWSTEWGFHQRVQELDNWFRTNISPLMVKKLTSLLIN